MRGCQRDHLGLLCPHQPDRARLAVVSPILPGRLRLPAGAAGTRSLRPGMAAGTGIAGAHLRGIHLRLPGHGDAGPTLEIFSYDQMAERPPTAVNRPGFGHLAFSVEDVAAARKSFLPRADGPSGSS